MLLCLYDLAGGLITCASGFVVLTLHIEVLRVSLDILHIMDSDILRRNFQAIVQYNGIVYELEAWSNHKVIAPYLRLVLH